MLPCEIREEPMVQERYRHNYAIDEDLPCISLVMCDNLDALTKRRALYRLNHEKPGDCLKMTKCPWKNSFVTSLIFKGFGGWWSWWSCKAAKLIS